MEERSHVDAMRAAIRGDFERLERRRGTQELMRIARPAPPPDAATAIVRPESGSGAEPAPPKGWLGRLLSR